MMHLLNINNGFMSKNVRFHQETVSNDIADTKHIKDAAIQFIASRQCRKHAVRNTVPKVVRQTITSWQRNGMSWQRRMCNGSKREIDYSIHYRLVGELFRLVATQIKQHKDHSCSYACKTGKWSTKSRSKRDAAVA
jgi:hypothetical protein